MARKAVWHSPNMRAIDRRRAIAYVENYTHGMEFQRMATLEQLEAKKAALQKRIAQTKARQSGLERRADTHLKAALGGAVLIALNNPQISHTLKVYLLNAAEGGIQKQGVARARFEELKARHTPSPSQNSASI
jgi:hypothetical protein